MRILWVNPWQNTVKILFSLLIIVSLLVLVVRGFEWRNHWDRIVDRQTLTVAVRESEGIYWPGPSGFVGLENDLLTELELRFGLPIQIFAVDNLNDLYRALEVGAVDFALSGTSIATSEFPASLPYSTSRLGLVTLNQPGDEQPAQEMNQQRFGILDPVAHAETIAELKRSVPNAEIVEGGAAELFTRLALSELNFVLTDERDFKLQQSVFPDLRFIPLGEAQRPISILFNPSEDGSAIVRVNAVLSELENTGLLTQFTDRYFGEALEFDYVDNLTFEKHVAERLPAYEALFKEYADVHSLDWRLVAAVAYQESHWRANARSPTGVRGLMMVTLRTAEEMGITNRLDPEQSVLAGTQYLMSLKDRIPERIEDPDRTWFALAAYNVGMGHLEDARRITELLEDDPDKWIDVRQHLPKLALPDYYPWTRFGYARGNEPVVYVANIRRFYDWLQKLYPQTDDAVEPERLDALPSATVPLFPGF